MGAREAEEVIFKDEGVNVWWFSGTMNRVRWASGHPQAVVMCEGYPGRVQLVRPGGTSYWNAL